MKAYILSFRRGSNTQYQNQVILEVEGVGDRGRASQLIGRKVIWVHPKSGKRFGGKIVGVLGCKGRVVARFRRTLPGQAIGSEATVL